MDLFYLMVVLDKMSRIITLLFNLFQKMYFSICVFDSRNMTCHQSQNPFYSTMDNMDIVHRQRPSTWTLSIDTRQTLNMDIVHRQRLLTWTLSIDRMDIVHGYHGHWPWTVWTLTMDSMDIDQSSTAWLLSMDIHYLSMDKCFNTPWTIVHAKSMETHGQSVAGHVSHLTCVNIRTFMFFIVYLWINFRLTSFIW